MQSDGNLVLYRASQALWATGGSGTGARAVMQGDGNFVVYNGSTAKWSSNTAGFDGSVLRLQDDGNLVVYDAGRAIWTWSGGYSGHVLGSGQQLTPGRMARSSNGAYRLVMQTDGNLVLYRSSQALWATGGMGVGSRVAMQTDGNLVVYNGSTPKWSSNGAGFGGAYLAVQDDGNAVVYHSGHAIWTWGSGYMGDTLNAGAALAPGAYLKSPNHAFTLVMQGSDSNLVIYGPSGAVWGWGSDGQGGASATMQGDGNFVVQRGSTVLRNTGTGGRNGAFLRMQNDDNLVVYQGSSPLWSRKDGLLGGGGPGQYSPPDWWPLRGSNRVGCTRNSPGAICGGNYHSWWAIDVDAPEGQPIYAAGAGLAKVYSNVTGCSGYGRAVVVEHGGSTKSLYGHMSNFAPAISANPGGVWVGPDTVIGYVGHTGNTSRCSFNHLHYEETTSGGFGSAASDPGGLLGCIDSSRVSYPSHWGRNSWNGLPGQTFTARSDHRNC